MTQTIADRYQPTAVIGLGGQGYVLHARDLRHDRDVAIKVRTAATEDERAALLREARVLLTVDPHPNLPLAREDFYVDARYCIVMDWIEGSSLAEMLAATNGSGLPSEVVFDALGQVAAALDHLHAHDPPVLHLDVKPANIVRRDDGRFVLVDLGLSGSGSVRNTGGTPAYLAPELAHGSAPGPRSDVFSLAVTAFELLTKTLPAPGVTPEWQGIPPDQIEHVRGALRRGLATDPARRPASASAFVASLRPRRTPNNLPASLSSFVGREDELNEIARLLRSERCLSLVGTGGIGKTRLALEAASASLDAFSGGVRLVELAALEEDSAFDAHVARALGVRDESGRTPLEGVVEVLRRGRQLLVLDNCEHVVDAAARTVEHVLRACPESHILTTSREPLRVAGEVAWRVGPLRVVEATADAGSSEAVRLFRERARAAAPHVELQELEVVAHICRTLEGIPLAIELAAALVADLSPEEIFSGLDDLFSTLVRGPRTVPRHETLRATLAWSYGLLSDAERDLLGRISAFSGTFTADAAAAVRGEENRCPIGSLVDRSLCESRGESYRLLEPVRRFAGERLREAGHEEETRDAHLAWHLALAGRAAARLRASDQARWFASLDDATEDLDAAISWALSRGMAEDAARIAISLGGYWQTRGRWEAGRRLLERCLPAAPRALRAPLLVELGSLLRSQGDLASAGSTFEEAIELLAGNGPTATRARAGLARLRADHGDHAGATEVFSEVLATAETRGDREIQLDALSDLGRCAHYLGDLPTAASRYLEALDIARDLGDVRSIARIEVSRGTIAYSQGDLALARQRFEEARTLGAELADRELIATATACLASSIGQDGDNAGSRTLFEESLEIFRELGHRQRVAQTLCELASSVMEEDMARARLLLEESRELATELGLDLIVGECLHKLSLFAHAEGDRAGAMGYLGDALSVCADHGDKLRLAMLLEHGAVLASAADSHEDAITIAAAAQAHRERIGYPRPADMPVLAAALDRSIGALAGDAAARAAERGRGMSLEGAIRSIVRR